MTQLDDACTDLAAWLTVAAKLITEHDTDGTTTHGQVGSRPPWNGAVAAAYFDATEGTRRLEASLRLAVTGRPGPARGGSIGNTVAALQAIPRLGEAVDRSFAIIAARLLARWATAIQLLPAVDVAERAQRVYSACPYCGFQMLRVFPRSWRVTCLRFGVCEDGDGNHPAGQLAVSRLTGTPVIEWKDGLVT